MAKSSTKHGTHGENTVLPSLIHHTCNLLAPMRWCSPVEEPHKTLWSHLVLGLWCYVFRALLPRVLQQPHRTGVYVNSCLGVMTHCCCCCCTEAHSAPVYLSIPLEYIALDEAPCSTPVQYWRGSAQVGCIHNKMDLAYKSCAFQVCLLQVHELLREPQDANVSNKVPAPDTNTPAACFSLFFVNTIQNLPDLRRCAPIYAEIIRNLRSSQPGKQVGWLHRWLTFNGNGRRMFGEQKAPGLSCDNGRFGQNYICNNTVCKSWCDDWKITGPHPLLSSQKTSSLPGKSHRRHTATELHTLTSCHTHMLSRGNEIQDSPCLI